MNRHVSPLTADDQALARFVGLVSAVAVTRDGDALRACFADLSDEIAFALAREVAAFLERRAKETSDWKTWALALHHLPRPGRREAASLLAEKLAAGAPARPDDGSRRKLLRACFRLLERGVGARDLVAQMRDLNAAQDHPLSVADLDKLIVWAAKKHRSDRAQTAVAEVSHA